MPLEIEGRFLVTGPGWRAHAGEPQHLRQGYLVSSEDGFTVRVRLRADGKAWLTLKAPAEGIARHEFEYELPSADSKALWALAPHRLTKTRFALSLPGGDWVIDCFEGENAPLVKQPAAAGEWDVLGRTGATSLPGLPSIRIVRTAGGQVQKVIQVDH